MSSSKSLLFFSVALLLISPVTTSTEAARGDQFVTTMDRNTLSGTNAALRRNPSTTPGTQAMRTPKFIPL